MQGSEHNDVFVSKNNNLSLKTNNSGGSLGGVSTG
jgi:chorismate synthase